MKPINWILSFSVFFAVPTGVAFYATHIRSTGVKKVGDPGVPIEVEISKDGYPVHWGPKPEIETRDYRKLPEPYGYGSSTLYNWIKANQERDAK